LKQGDILFSHINSPTHIGKTGIYGGIPEILIHGINLLLLRPKKSIVYPNYLNYFLKTKSVRKYFEIRCKKAVNQASLNQKAVTSIKIPLPFLKGKPDLETQKQIVAILEKAEALKQKQKRALELHDEYLKSVFYEMFLKEKGKWEEKSLSEVCEIIMGQSPAGSSYNKSQNGMPFFQGKAEFGERYPKVKYWTTEPSKIAEPNSILMSVRAPVGSVNVCNVKCCMGRGLASIKPKEVINLEYLFSLLKILENKIADLGSGSTFKAINSGQLRGLKIPLPPFELQQKFADIVEKVERLKEKQKKSLEDSEELFNVLMQKAFRGELAE